MASLPPLRTVKSMDNRVVGGYLVECYWPGVNIEILTAAGGRARAAASALVSDVVIRGCILVPDDETVFYLFDGAEDDVRAVSLRAGVPFERIVNSLSINPSSLPRMELQ